MSGSDGRLPKGRVKLGLQRAGLHMLRAGYEVVAGVAAFLDEVVRVRRDEPPTPDEGPTKIELD
jgi:hypothetical protein